MADLTIVQKITVWAIPLLFAVTLHEVAHGWVADLFGDHTARAMGRLTINPLKHIDPIGTIVVPILLLVFGGFVFGWAKPVPVNPRNISKPRIEMPIISLAGPIANFLMALLWGAVAKCGYMVFGTNPWLGEPLIYMGEVGIVINSVLAILNLLPITPLDGGRALSYLFSGKVGRFFQSMEPYGFFILIFLIATGMLSRLVGPLYLGLQSFIFGIFNLS